MAEQKSTFEQLNHIDVGERIEKKGKLSYLSWAWAWKEVKERFPNTNYTVYENKDGWNYHTDGRTCWVKVGVAITLVEHIEYLPVMDNQNKSIPLEKVTSFDVNTAIQRALTKAIARHGLGLYIYAGEDLPEVDPEETKNTLIKMLKACKSREDFVKAYHKVEEMKLLKDDEVNKEIIECSKKFPAKQKNTDNETEEK